MDLPSLIKRYQKMDENITLIFLPQENHETLIHQAISNGTTGRIAVLFRHEVD